MNGLSAFDNLDRLNIIEMRLPTLPQGYIPQLYAAARGNGEPLLHRAASALAALPPGRVAIFAGVYVPGHLDIGEMDGPLGAAVLAAVLERLGHEPQVVVEPSQVDAVRQLCEIAGASDTLVATLDMLVDNDVAAYAHTLAAAISIEKLSANAQGVRHSLLGSPLDAQEPRTDDVFNELAKLGRLTIGFGDGGNEIGFGAIREDVARILDATATCNCGCESGIVAATSTSHIIPSAISNVGAYALTAALALLLDQPDLAVAPERVYALIEGGMEAGLLDGGTLDPNFIGDDGIPGSAIRAIVELMSTIVHQQLRDVAERPF